MAVKNLKTYWLSSLIILVLGVLFLPISLAKESLEFNIEPLKQIYSSHEGLVMKVTFTAREKTKLCLAKDILSQLQVNISRPGKGRIPLQPLVLKDNSKLFQEPMKVLWLNSGQALSVRVNLKRLQFVSTEQWVPGEYSVNASFSLCEQNEAMQVSEPGQEITIPAKKPAWFMIMI